MEPIFSWKAFYIYIYIYIYSISQGYHGISICSGILNLTELILGARRGQDPEDHEWRRADWAPDEHQARQGR